MTDAEGNTLLRLLPAGDIGKHGIAVSPRWPYKEVLVTPAALAALRKANTAVARQAPGLNLALIRGYETPVQTLRRNLLRLLGLSAFFVLYPWRCREILTFPL